MSRNARRNAQPKTSWRLAQLVPLEDDAHWVAAYEITSKTGLPFGIRKPLGNQAEFGVPGVRLYPLRERQDRPSGACITPKLRAVNRKHSL